MSRIGLFVDVSNLYYCVPKAFNGRRLDYLKFRNHALKGELPARMIAYGASIGTQAAGFISLMEKLGFEMKYKRPKSIGDIKKSNWKVGIAMDVVRMVEELDLVIVGSADGDLAPLVQWLSEIGKESHILACGISRELETHATSYEEITEGLLQ